MSWSTYWFRKRAWETWNELKIKNGEEPVIIDEFSEGLYPQPDLRNEVQSLNSELEQANFRFEALMETLREYSELKERVRLNNEKLKSGLSNN